MDVVVAAALWNSVCICAWAAGAIAIASAWTHSSRAMLSAKDDVEM